MLKNRNLLWLILPIILFAFSINGFAFDYRYTQESGTGFFVNAADKSDALEDENEIRQIVNDLGTLLEHSKLDGTYPADATTGGTLGVFGNYYLKTEIDTLAELETIWVKDVTDSAELATALSDYYLKTDINTLGKVETIYGVDITTSTELATYTETTQDYLKTSENDDTADDLSDNSILDLTDTPVAYDNGKVLKSTVDGTEWATDANTTYVSSDFTHDSLTGVTANEHIDWTTDQGATNIHSGNYTDTNTTYTAGTGLDLTGTVFSSNITQYTDALAITAIKGDAAWNATNWDSAYGWGDWSGQGFITDITGESLFSLSDIPVDPNADKYLQWDDDPGVFLWADAAGGGASTFLDLTDTPAAYDDGKYAKSTAAGIVFDTPAGAGNVANTGTPVIYDYARFTDATTIEGRSYTEMKTDLAYQLSDLSDVNTSTPTNRFVLIADGTDFESRALVEADISDLGTYLTDITGQSILSLSDVAADPNADKYLMWDDSASTCTWQDAGAGGGYTNLTSFVDQTAWRFFYSNTAGDVTELALGTDGQVLTSAGVDIAPAFEDAAGGDALTTDPLSQFAATTSAQLAGVISDETGTDKLVYNTSPTLVTPILGTPTSGALTNCTFPTLNQDTTGTAAEATILETARTIGGVSFNGSANIAINIKADTTPELGGELDAKDKNITGAGSIGFTQELDNGSKTANFTVDFATDQKQKVTMTENTLTLTLDTTNVKVGNYLLKIVNGGLATLTWASESGSIYFPGGTDPDLTSSGTDITTFYFDGTNWYGCASLDFK